MSFKRKTVVQAAPTPDPVPEPAPPPQGGVAPATTRRKRLASGGVQSTFLGSIANAALPPPGPTLTGVR